MVMNVPCSFLLICMYSQNVLFKFWSRERLRPPVSLFFCCSLLLRFPFISCPAAATESKRNPVAVVTENTGRFLLNC